MNALNLSETDAIEAESNETNSISGDNACGVALIGWEAHQKSML